MAAYIPLAITVNSECKCTVTFLNKSRVMECSFTAKWIEKLGGVVGGCDDTTFAECANNDPVLRTFEEAVLDVIMFNQNLDSEKKSLIQSIHYVEKTHNPAQFEISIKDFEPKILCFLSDDGIVRSIEKDSLSSLLRSQKNQ